MRDALRLVIMNRAETAAGAALDAVPGSLTQLISGSQQLEQTAQLDTLKAVESLIDAVLEGPMLYLIEKVLFLIIFTAVLIAVRKLSRLLSGIKAFPIIGEVNTALGGILGVLEGVTALFILALAMHLFIAMTSGGYFWLSDEMLDASYVWRYFYTITKFSA